MFIIQDNFYQHPDSVRNLALSWEFSIKGNYPGKRTKPCGGAWFYTIKETFERILNKKIVYWPSEYNTAFQYTTEDATTWVHHDCTSWACVVYLTPDAPLDSGTAIYRHKPTGIYKHSSDAKFDFNSHKTLDSDWEIIAEAKNIYNRAVIYDANYYHRSVLPGFGTDKHNARLFQTFFFNTED